MQSAITDLINLNNLWTTQAISFCVGKIVKITEEGRAIVDYPGNPTGTLEARSVVNAPFKSKDYSEENISVLLFFENGDPALPIIGGIIHDTLYPHAPSEEITVSMERSHDAVLDGKKMILQAREEIVLHCGKSSVTLKKDGKIVLKGIQIVSRASGTNKIKGASVKIN
jgi:hypothetical protein